MFISGKNYAFINANSLWSDVLHFTGIKRRAYDRNQCNFCQGMFITYTINAPSEVFLLCCWRDEIVDKVPVDGDENDDDVLTNAGWYKNMINILNQFNKNYQMKTIKTYIQARRRKFSNNGGGVGLLGGGGGWLLERWLLVVVLVVLIVLVLMLSVSSAVKAVKSLLANKLIFCMWVFLMVVKIRYLQTYHDLLISREL